MSAEMTSDVNKARQSSRLRILAKCGGRKNNKLITELILLYSVSSMAYRNLCWRVCNQQVTTNNKVKRHECL